METDAMRRQEQGISMVGFLVTGALLAVALIGGIYAVRHVTFFGGAESAEVAQTDIDSNSDGDTTDKNTESTTESAPGKTDTKADGENDDSTSSTSQSTKQRSETTDSTDTSTEAAESDLPKTGPLDETLPLLGVSMLAAAISAYIVSRKELV